mgnify:CR=1 FL=1
MTKIGDSLMEEFSIRPFTKSDIEFAYESIKIEKWNYAKADVERMFNYNPSGCFIAEIDGKRVGHIFSVNYGRLGWIGFLIVKAEHRRKGVGALLMQKAMNHLLNRGVETIRLEAVPAIADLYRKLGFVDEYYSLRFLGINQRKGSAQSLDVKIMKKEMIKEIAKFDAEYFGADRVKVLMGLYHANPRLCFVSYTGSKIAGYIMCRKAEDGYRVGPWVCNPENSETTRGLLKKCIEKLGEDVKLYVGVPAENKVAVKIMREFGFEQYSKSIRMRFGNKLTERIGGIFAIGGPEKG